jgi:hypothetical protein
MAGRRSIDETNKIRATLGLAVIPKKRGRPKVDRGSILPMSKKAIAQETLSKMLGEIGKQVVNKILSKALDDNDDDQMACLKLVADRILPTSYFEKVKQGGNGVTIQIVGIEPQLLESRDTDVVEGELIDD